MKLATAALVLTMAGPAAAAGLTISSSDFKDDGALPVVHNYPRCGGQNISPDLRWVNVPAAARSLVLTMIDTTPQPNGWSHWLVVDLAPSSTGLGRGIAQLPPGAKVVGSNFGDAFYDGPCPPPGTGVHRYEFTIWAMPGPATSIPANGPAKELSALLTKTALAHATITGLVAAPLK
ncbi:MAG: YbhB/YbcL family Raf kinase inhibitor-like protein [Alphaproteobacteria bacterium]|nr:YbhB/YbcL family Raf kinase inhibitor-like protein [Alphaproteobacteria bacterium]